MNTWINFKELREKLDFAAVLAHYGVDLKSKRGDRQHGFCPLPTHGGNKRSASFSVHTARGIFQCFGCGAKGNVLDFVALMQGLDPGNGQELRKAALALAEAFGISTSRSGANLTHSSPQKRNAQALDRKEKETQAAHEKAGRAVTHPAIVNAPLDFKLKKLDPSHPYLEERGFTQETIAHFGLGYCSRGVMQGRIAIPLHDAHGKLVGYAGRLVDESALSEAKPKYLFPGSREREGKRYEFQKSLFLYNGFAVGRVSDLVLVEGFPSVWWLWQNGYENTAALMGWSCSPEQAALVIESIREDGRLWLMPDGDAAGERCANTVLKFVSPHRSVRWLKLDKDKQPTDCTNERLTDLLHPLRA
jgi:DNA primase